MNEKINKLIPKTIKAIKDAKIEEDRIVKKEFKGYISSMGASIIQAGLLPTLAFYQNDAKTKAKSSYLLNAILKLLKDDTENDENLITYVIRKANKKDNNGDIVNVSSLDIDELYLIEDDITDILIALKLALRTFKLSEDD